VSPSLTHSHDSMPRQPGAATTAARLTPSSTASSARAGPSRQRPDWGPRAAGRTAC
jgi:hypothetical protein